MKTLIAMGGVLALLAVFLVVKVSMDPSRGLAGASHSLGPSYEAWTVLYRDGSFQQLVRDTKTRRVYRHRGSWVDVANDTNSQLFLSQTKTQISEPYLNLKNKVRPEDLIAGKPLHEVQSSFSLMPTSSFHLPNPNELKTIESLQADKPNG